MTGIVSQLEAILAKAEQIPPKEYKLTKRKTRVGRYQIEVECEEITTTLIAEGTEIIFTLKTTSSGLLSPRLRQDDPSRYEFKMNNEIGWVTLKRGQTLSYKVSSEEVSDTKGPYSADPPTNSRMDYYISIDFQGKREDCKSISFLEYRRLLDRMDTLITQVQHHYQLIERKKVQERSREESAGLQETNDRLNKEYNLWSRQLRDAWNCGKRKC